MSFKATAALVVIYNPDSGVVDRLQPLLGRFALFCVVDNSDRSCQEMFRQAFAGEAAYRYIRNGNRGGIAGALNRGLEMAASEGMSWVLTLDQDSEVNQAMLDELLAVRQLLNGRRKAGIIAALHHLAPSPLPEMVERYQKIGRVMTSGNLLSVAAFQKTGPFREELFIDSVDYDFCLRLQLAGFSIFRANRAVLIHHLGKMAINRLFGLTFHTSNHPPRRRYYITRNRLAVAFKYCTSFPAFFVWEIKNFIKEFFGILVFEQQKLVKLKMVGRGVLDFVLGRMGEADF